MRLVVFIILLHLLPFSVVAADNATTEYTMGVDAFRDKKTGAFADILGNPVSGVVRYKHERSQIEREYPVSNGLIHGTVREWKNGKLLVEANYSKGKNYGISRSLYPNGNNKVVVYDFDGENNGVRTEYNEDGSIKAELLFRNGRGIIGYTTAKDNTIEITGKKDTFTLGVDAFFDNLTQTYVDEGNNSITGLIYAKGVLSREMQVKNGKLDGMVKTYRAGALISEVMYRQGNLHGAATTFYKNGRPELTSYYSYGLIDGLTTSWYQNGVIIHEVIFRNGKAVSGYLTYEKKIVALTKSDLDIMEEIYKTSDRFTDPVPVKLPGK